MSEILGGLVLTVVVFHAFWLQRRCDKLELLLGRLGERRSTPAGGKTYLN